MLNFQGDVIGLVDVNGGTLVTYRYNAWGVQTGYTLGRANADIFYECNALKYRGYYYDVETGFYYLQTRYYGVPS